MMAETQEKQAELLASALRPIGKRIPFYFVLASLCIWPVAAVQLSLIKRMPIWNTTSPENKMRILECYTVQQNRLAVAHAYQIDQRAKDPFYLCLLVSGSAPNRQHQEYACVGAIAAKISPDGRWVALADNEQQVSIQQLDRIDQQTAVQLTCNSRVQGMHWSPDSSHLLVCAAHQVVAWDCALQRKIEMRGLDPSLLIVPHPNSPSLVAGVNRGYCLISWSGQIQRSLPIDPRARSIALSADLRYVAFAVNEKLFVVNLMTGKRIATDDFKLATGCRQIMSFSPSGNRLALVHSHATNSSDRMVSVLNLEGDVAENSYASALTAAGIQFASSDSLWVWQPSGAVELIQLR